MNKETPVLIVLAHPEPRSFNAQWARATAIGAQDAGHEVLWSDLYTIGFNPAESARHYQARDADPHPFDAMDWQEKATRRGNLPPDVVDEIDKIRAAAMVVFHFPLWWFGPPAMLKGWFDRVFVHGELHSSDRRFDRGDCDGKRALFCVTTGSSAEESSPHGKEGDINLLLWPVAYSLRYLGFTILEPKIVHGVHGFKKDAEQDALTRQLETCLADQSELITNLDQRAAWQFNPDHSFGPDGRLNPGEPTFSLFIKPRPSDRNI